MAVRRPILDELSDAELKDSSTAFQVVLLDLVRRLQDLGVTCFEVDNSTNIEVAVDDVGRILEALEKSPSPTSRI